jgi:hypothetical protein
MRDWRARREGQTLGRKRQRISPRDLERVASLSVRHAAKALGVPASRVHNERRRVFGNRSEPAAEIAEENDAVPVRA